MQQRDVDTPHVFLLPRVWTEKCVLFTAIRDSSRRFGQFGRDEEDAGITAGNRNDLSLSLSLSLSVCLALAVAANNEFSVARFGL